MIKGSFNPFSNLLGEGTGQDWKVYRYPFEDAVNLALTAMQLGYLVKFNAAGSAVLGAVAADDAVLAGIIVDLPGTEELQNTSPPTTPTVAIAVSGTFDENQIHYADYDPDNPVALSAGARQRLRDINIFLDPAITAGAIAP